MNEYIKAISISDFEEKILFLKVSSLNVIRKIQIMNSFICNSIFNISIKH